MDDLLVVKSFLEAMTPNPNTGFQQDERPAVDMDAVQDHFDQGERPDARQYEMAFHVNLDGFEGPIDLLLHLAREQKVDLTQISILALADQYLALIEDLKSMDLQVAADFLVMAAWLAFLKSRLLLPKEEQSVEELSAEELQRALARRLQLLEAMQKAGQSLMDLPRLGEDVFARPEMDDDKRFNVVEKETFKTELFDLLKAYARIHKKSQKHEFRIPVSSLFSVEDGMKRLRQLLGDQFVPDWKTMESFLPESLRSPIERRSATASLFVASLDLAKNGVLSINQEDNFGPIYFKSIPKQEAA